MTRAHSPATAELLSAVESATSRHRDFELPVSDLVHGDFATYNVLALDGRVTAVVDCDAAGKGTRALDLAMMFGEDYPDLTASMRDQILGLIRNAAGEPGIAICLAYQIITFVAYAIQHDPPHRVPSCVSRGWALLSHIAP